MLSDIINPDTYASKKLNSFKSDLFIKQIIALLILNFLYLFCKEFCQLILINIFAVLLLVKVNELIINKNIDKESPCFKIVIVNSNENLSKNIDQGFSSSPHIIVNTNEDPSNYDIHIEQEAKVCSNNYITNSVKHVNKITNSEKENNFKIESQAIMKNTSEIFTQTPVTENFNRPIQSDNLKFSCKASNVTNKCEFSKNEPTFNDHKIEDSSSSTVLEKANKGRSLMNDNSSFNFNLNSILSLLPKFNGDSKMFLKFKHRFHTIINQFDLNISQKGLLLYLSLNENVSETLGFVSVNGIIDYHKLWQKLESEYYGPQHGPLYNGALLNTISSWSICNTSEKLTHLYKFVMTNFRSLEIQGLAEPDLVTAITVLGKLEGNLATEVSKTILENQGRPVLLKILRLIKEELNSFELQKVVNGSHDELKNTEIASPQNVIKDCEYNFQKVERRSLHKLKNSSSYKCKFCNCYHDPKICPKFTNPYDFYLYLKKNYACFNCTEVGHRSFACPKLKMCDSCSDPRKHSSLLCNKNYNS